MHLGVIGRRFERRHWGHRCPAGDAQQAVVRHEKRHSLTVESARLKGRFEPISHFPSKKPEPWMYSLYLALSLSSADLYAHREHWAENNRSGKNRRRSTACMSLRRTFSRAIHAKTSEHHRLLSACLLLQPLEAILELVLSPFIAVEHGFEQLVLLLQKLLVAGRPRRHNRRRPALLYVLLFVV